MPNETGASNVWVVFTVLAGLCWGTYVPMIAYGGQELGRNRYGAFLCVGVAYFVIAVLFPLGLFLSGNAPWPQAKAAGLAFASLAGAAGAFGALFVIFAATAAGGPAAKNYLYIAPLIFGLAPVVNTVVSAVWHPRPGDPARFGFEPPGPKLVVGILLVGVGAALVLYSKEEAEAAARAKTAAPPAAVTAETPAAN